MRVGLFGGSFNPAHEGHRHVAETALRRLDLDRVVWLVSPQNPLKRADETAPLAARMASARALATGPAMIVSDLETRIGTRWTIDTLRALTARHPGTDIFRLMPIAVVARPGSLLESRTAPAATRFAGFRVPSRKAVLLPGAPAPAWTWLRAPLHPQSSTALRVRGAARPAPGGPTPGA
jgi:nicotinate-nucleotide adenylyltransferase